MGIVDLLDIVKERLRSDRITLVSITRGVAKKCLEARLKERDTG